MKKWRRRYAAASASDLFKGKRIRLALNWHRAATARPIMIEGIELHEWKSSVLNDLCDFHESRTDFMKQTEFPSCFILLSDMHDHKIASNRL